MIKIIPINGIFRLEILHELFCEDRMESNQRTISFVANTILWEQPIPMSKNISDFIFIFLGRG